MTAACGGGASQPKQVSPVAGFFGGATLGIFAEEALGLPAIWADLLLYCAAQSIDWTSFCAADPPTMPTFTLSDVTNILTMTFDPARIPSFQKLIDLALNAAWFYGCECTSGSAPTAPTNPTYPSGAPNPNPTGYPVGTTDKCWDVIQTFIVPASGSTAFNLNSLVPSGGATISVTPCTGCGARAAQSIPTGIAFVDTTFSVTYPGSLSVGADVTLDQYNSSGTKVQTDTLLTVGASGSSHTKRTFIAPTAVYWNLWVPEGTGQVMTYTGELSFYCNGNPQNPNAPCCPPDPELTARLQMIQNALLDIYNIVQGLPAKPASYIDGTAHTHLVGSGSFALASDTVAIRVHLESAPPPIGIESGTPTFYFDAGWITPLAGGDPYKPRRVTYDNQIFYFNDLTDEIAWTLPTGAEITITELKAG